MIEAEIGQLDGIGLCGDCFARDLQLKVQLQKSEVVVRHIADQGQDYRLPRIVCRQQLGASGLGGATQAAEEIQLKGSISDERKKVVLRLETFSLPPLKLALADNLGKQAGTRDRNLSACSVNSFGSQLQDHNFA